MEKIRLTKEEYVLLKSLTCNVDPNTSKDVCFSKKTQQELKSVLNKYFDKPDGKVELPKATLDKSTTNTNGVDVGEPFAIVIDSEPHTYTLVNKNAIDSNSEVSVKSLLGQAVLGKCEGETFVYEDSDGKHYCRIVSVQNKDF